MEAVGATTHTAYGNNGVDMPTSVEDLIGRMVIACERKVSRSASLDQELLSLGLPKPQKVKNEQLSELEPFYIQLLQNIENMKGEENILSRLDMSEDDAMFLLYILSYPLLVLNSRNDKFGFNNCSVHDKKNYGFSDIAERIICNKSLLHWCRNAIRNENQYFCIMIIQCAVSILCSVDTISLASTGLSVKKIKTLVRTCIFDGKDDEKGFRVLHDELAHIVSRQDATPTVIQNSVCLQIHSLKTVDNGNDKLDIQRMMEPSKEIFRKALFRAKDELNDMVFKFSLLWVDEEFAKQYQHDIVQQVGTTCGNKDEEHVKSTFVCGYDGCSKVGNQRCTRCKMVGYCSKGCQVKHWAIHKKVCKPKNIKTKKVDAAIETARQARKPALIELERILQQQPDMDYSIVFPGSTQTQPFSIADPKRKKMFRSLRQIAPTTSYAVHLMHKMLVNQILPYHLQNSSIIRTQLIAEYGVDPLSDTAKNGPLTKELVTLMVELGISKISEKEANNIVKVTAPK
mmetsp:Transcript_57237/g.66097  ORF Transcript_57237/g.66097 Transcript_57237/m.66097 type:complete len:514 (+) Transcript_57237:332-1873(+)|eukprot:CAMPEP_0170804460 /NCGR_PEP_ID=MMETSP0733-20121128/30724_1 /TAXON_ID=186038 /ORGANISM="Fragilariopsis kerguelensis, Strain L26-C5" /LENGTH=513 /DNA_ID=CAMNT_0011158527 /DNA_START=163 /DNA_END=1704 /DNA_ORIENTATION=+